jgi:anti-anti-sigma factor
MSDEAPILQIERRPNGLRLVGDIDAAGVDELVSHLDPLPDTESDIIIDLADVTFIDSSGFRTLIEAHQRAESLGRRVMMADPSPAVKRLFDISGLVPYLHIGTNDS